MADVRSPILVCGLSWELLCVLLRMRLICSEIAGNVFWRAMACSPPLPAKTRHSAKSLAGDGGRCRVLAANGV